jgi:protocatechuate 3,4-dioxygenase beta subunit
MKPIAVLLLVLVAVGALIFGLVTLGGGPDNKTNNPVNLDPASAGPKNTSKPAEIEKGPDTTARREDPVKPVEDRTPLGEFRYANELRVLVVDAQQKPVANVEVTLTTLSSNDLFFLDSTLPAYQVGPLRTGPEGRVSFLGIQPNHSSYTLVCVHPDYARQECLTLPIEQDGVLEEPPIVLVSGTTLQGTVKDEQGGPIAGAKLVLEGLLAQVQQSRAPDRLETTSDAAGVYAIKNIPRGAQRSLSVGATGFGRTIVHGLNFPDTRPKTQDFVLRVAEMITGRVVGVGNQPLPQAKVMALGVNGTLFTARDDQVTNERGEFQFESLVPGEYNVIATLKGWRIPPQNRIHTNTAGLVLEGTRMASVCGQVADAATGAPITQFSAQLRNFNDAVTPTSPIPDTKASFSDAGGSFCLEGVEQGNYVIEASADGYAPTRSGNFTVSNDRNVEHIPIRLTRGGSISGRLVDPDNHPIGKARVRTKSNDWAEDDFFLMNEDILPSNATQLETRTGPDGSFSLKGLAPDQYQLLFEGSGFTRASKTDISVTEGTNNSLGNVQMARGGTLVGTVYDATGKGVPGAGVQLFSADGASPRQYRTKTAVDGKFTLRYIAQGRYKARPSPPSAANTNPLEELRIGGDAERQITIADDQETKLDLTLPVSAPQAAPQTPIEDLPAKPLPPGSRDPTSKPH